MSGTASIYKEWLVQRMRVQHTCIKRRCDEKDKTF